MEQDFTAKESKLKWLVTEWFWDEFSNKGEGDSLTNTLLENGIFTKHRAQHSLESARLENDYTKTDYCPFCKHTEYYTLKSGSREGAFKCKKCAKNYSLTTGTYLENTKLEFYYWYRFAYLVGDCKTTSSAAIERDLQVTQKTAWYMLDTLRTAHKDTGRKFTNGAEVLNFTSRYSVLDVLMRLKINNQPDLINDAAPLPDIPHPVKLPLKIVKEKKVVIRKSKKQKSLEQGTYISIGRKGENRFRELAEEGGFPMNFEISYLAIPETDNQKRALINDLKRIRREVLVNRYDY